MYIFSQRESYFEFPNTMFIIIENIAPEMCTCFCYALFYYAYIISFCWIHYTYSYTYSEPEWHLFCVGGRQRKVHEIICVLMSIPYLTHLPLNKMADTFADDIFKRIFLNENVGISIQISPKFVPSGANDNKSELVQVMDWCQTGDKPLPEQMRTRFTAAYMRH